MKILHCMLSCTYNEGYKYQENIISSINKLDGNEVKIIASTIVFAPNNKAGFTKPGRFINEDGIEVVRLPFRNLNKKLGSKLKIYKGLDPEIEEFQPDVIMYHGAGGYALLNVTKYVKKHHIKLFVDCHQFYQNSATNWFSKHLLHKFYNRIIMKKADKYVTQFLPVTYEAKVFMNEMYGIPYNRMKLYPLGGIFFEENERKEFRKKIRSGLNIDDDQILLLHSGKIDRIKKTETIISAIQKINSNKLKLVIIGSISEDIRDSILSKIELDDRISYIGWISGEELLTYLCAGDLYLQPGGMSVTLQNAMCCGCAVATYPHKGYLELVGDNVFYVEDTDSIIELIESILSNEELLMEKKSQAYKFARENLNYKELVKILYE